MTMIKLCTAAAVMLAAGTGQALAQSDQAASAPQAGQSIDTQNIDTRGIDTQQAAEPKTTLTGDWGGLRTTLADKGINVGFSALSEVASNVSGGARHATTQVSGFALELDLDTEKLLGLKGGTFQIIGTKRQGPALIDNAGLNTLMPAQEIYARGQTYRLSDFWYMQKIGAKVDVKVGRMTMGEDFATLPCDFQNLSFCGNPVGNLVGAYWYNGPISQWAGRLRARPGRFSFQIGVYEYNPNNLLQDVSLSHSGAQGVTVPMEAGWMPRVGPHKLPGSYRIGAWYNTEKGTDLLTGVDGRPFALKGEAAAERRGRYGGYMLLQQQLTGSYVENADGSTKTTHGLTVFFNVTQTDRRTTRTDNQMALWFVYNSPLKMRPYDDMGIAIARTHVNGRAATAEVLINRGGERPTAEYTTEAYYSIHARPWFVVRPNIQYVVAPGGYSKAQDIVVFGLKTLVTF